MIGSLRARIIGILITVGRIVGAIIRAVFAIVLIAVFALATTPPAPPPLFLAGLAIFVGVGAFAAVPATGRGAGVVFTVVLVLILGNVEIVVIIVNDRFELGRFCRTRAGTGNAHLRAFILAFGHHFDGHAVTMFDFDQIAALFIEQVDRRFGAGTQPDQRALALGSFVLDQTQRRKARR